MWRTDAPLRMTIDGVALEGHCWGPSPQRAMTLVLLHEGLGSVSLWRDFPAELSKATGCGVFAFSRQGYGQSDPARLPRPIDYMTREAIDVLPSVLDQVGARQTVLIGHSDGASIAAIYSGLVDDPRLKGLCLMAPHFFTESGGLASIAAAKTAFETTDLKAKMARHHADPENTFRGWNDAWLNPAFAAWNIEAVIAPITVPVLAIQGLDDQYGTGAQLDVLGAGLSVSFSRVELADCKHSPQFEQPEQTLAAISGFAPIRDQGRDVLNKSAI